MATKVTEWVRFAGPRIEIQRYLTDRWDMKKFAFGLIVVIILAFVTWQISKHETMATDLNASPLSEQDIKANTNLEKPNREIPTHHSANSMMSDKIESNNSNNKDSSADR